MRSPYIAGPILDWVFLIGSPILGIALFFGLSALGPESLLSNLMLGAIYAHLVITVFRSHGNSKIFDLYPYRFSLIPVAMFFLLLISKTAMAITIILNVWWDVYHSSLQTFGIGRMYDQKIGNDLEQGWWLDYWLNLLIYAGPILGGASLLEHLHNHANGTAAFPSLQTMLLEWTPHQSRLSWALLTIGLAYSCYYLYAYWQLSKAGYRVSFQKVWLLVITAVVSLLCWGFSSFGGAFFIMNFFHAFQYFFLVGLVEEKNLTDLFRLSNVQHGRRIALALFVILGIAFGVWSQVQGERWISLEAKASLLLVISIMHFWYDGFIWSVRKGQV